MKFFPLGNVDSELVEGQQRLMNQCPELVRDLMDTSVRGSAAFCSCGIGTDRPVVALKAFLMLFSICCIFLQLLSDLSHLAMKFSCVDLHPICFLIWDVN